jgi:TonB-dependent receptor
MSKQTNNRLRAVTTSSWLAIGVALACTPAFAQNSTTTPPPTDAYGNTVADVIVVGARASQQSSIDRKKRANTPTDSIVADDVGSFPDRSINEAISRVAGTALSRNAFGEGEGVSIRGVGMDATRVELDGMGVQSTYGLALGTGGARSADMRELPSDLIKSVDIVKGSTADMTEGSLSGAVHIQTRTGLDFRKPYISLRVGAEQNSVTEKWTPDYNLVASRKFLDGRLGVIFNGSYRAVENVSHTQENAGSNGNDGLATLWDWDNSAEKTYSFNPALVGGPNGDVAFNNSTETPRTLLTKSAAAATKADCIAAFPFLPGTATDAQKTQRLNEQYTCLNQWNDVAPANMRSFMNSQEDKRTSLDLRFDYRVSDNFTVFAKVNRSERITDDQNRSRTLGNPIVNPNGRFFTTIGDADTPAQRYVNDDETGTGAGYFNWTLANLYPTAPSCLNITAPGDLCPNGMRPGDADNPMVGRGGANGQILLTPAQQYPGATPPAGTVSVPVRGMVTNIDPSTVVVDENHNVLSWTQYDNSVSIDQIDNYQPSKTNYVQIGGDYDGDRMRVEFMAGMTKATSTRIDMRTNRSYNYGVANIGVSPSGTWIHELPDTYDDTDPNNFVQLRAPVSGTGEQVLGPNNQYAHRAYTVDEQPLVTPNFAFTVRPRAAESQEKVAKVDVTYDLSDFSPFFTRVKSGVNVRNNRISSWGGGGTTIRDPEGTFGDPDYIPGIYLPAANVSGNYRGCKETDISKAIDDGIKGTNDDSTLGLCNFGFVQRNPNARQGQDTLTEEQMRQLFAETTEYNGLRFFNGYESSSPGWNGIDTGLLFSRLGQGQFANLDCVKVCTASDGNVYEQPVSRTDETTIAAYTMLDFEAEDLPFGMTFNGNVGIRGVHTTVEGTGQMVLNNTRVVSYDSATDTYALDTRTFRQNVSLTRETIDWLPSYNLNLWVVPDQVVLRYYYGKQVARPNIGQLVPGGTCTIDERNDVDSPYFDGDGESVCSGRVGNPALKPLTAVNQSVNVEWYPNRDTTVSLVYQKADIEIGGARGVDETGPLFRGSGVLDPVTGDPVDDLIFRYPTYENSPGFQRTGWEFTAKTAFTFLPWLFRHTGADFNISTLKASNATDAEVDPITGDIMDPRGQSKYYTNLSLWYDDGRAQVRISYQAREASFDGITPLSGSTNRNFPTESNNGVAPPYYPGQPRFTDETKYWDAKASYNVNDHVQVFLEGTNLTKQAQTYSTGGYRPYADGTPNIMRISWSGMRIRTGVTFKFQ